MAGPRQYLRFCLTAAAINLALCISLHAQTITTIKRASVAPSTNAQGESYSYDPSIDGSGRYVLFTSTADSFAAEGKVTGEFHEHVYLRDSLAGTTTQLDVTSEGRTGSPGEAFNPDIRVFRSGLHPHFSRDGKYAVFTSSESNISPDGEEEQYGNWAYIKNLETGDIHRIPYATAGDTSKAEYPAYLAVNSDASKVIVVSIISDVTDLNCEHCAWELTLYDREHETTSIVNTGVLGNKFNPGISDDGRFIVFENQVGDFSGPTYSYLYDLQAEELTPLNDGQLANYPAISGDGQYVAYTDELSFPLLVKLRHRETGQETIVSMGMSGAGPDSISAFPALSQDGRYTAFLSDASNLVSDDTNNSDDIFVFDRLTQNTTLVSVQGTCNNFVTREQFNTGPPSISSDGRTITFTVLERLIASDQKDENGAIIQFGDTNSVDDVYVATLDYDDQPDVFKKKLQPPPPFVSVNCTGIEARFQLEDILAARPGASAAGKRKPTSVKRITQDLVISKVDDVSRKRQIVKRSTAKKNIFTARKLPPGNYTVQVQGRAVLRNGTTIRTKLSRPAPFTITQ